MTMMRLKKWVGMAKKTVGHKGHLVAYSMEKRRFVIPLAYLGSDVFRELLKMSEQEFGLPTHGPITLPCDASFMEYVLTVLSKDLHISLLLYSIVKFDYNYV